jgi:hypothetical protein
MPVKAERNGFRATRGECVAVMLLYALLGPILGLLTGAVGMAVIGRELAVVPFVLMFGFLFAYYMGIIPAIVAGGVAVGMHLLVRGVPLWIGPTSGLVSFAALAARGPAGWPGEGEAWEYTALSLAVFVLPSILMWLLARVILRPSQGDAAPGVKKEIV